MLFTFIFHGGGDTSSEDVLVKGTYQSRLHFNLLDVAWETQALRLKFKSLKKKTFANWSRNGIFASAKLCETEHVSSLAVPLL